MAIFDDIGAIVIIALFYTSKVFVVALIVTVLCIPVLFFMNRRGVESRSLYIFIGLGVWVSMFKSGVYATLAGVLIAIFIPMESKTGVASPLKSLEHDLHHVVAFFVLPIFAFANAGIYVLDMSLDVVLHDVSIGVALGLILGKQIGVFGLGSLALWSGIVKFLKE